MNRHSGVQQPVSDNHASQQPHHRSSNSFNNPVPIPNGHSNGLTRARNGSLVGGPQQTEMGKSPPNMPSKNTKHVPCKFFNLGQCQAGNACPFLHTRDPMSHQTPCKYFLKGTCKFGAKCALGHYFPNGERVDKASLEPMPSRRYQRDNFAQFQHPDPNLNEPFLPAQGPPPQSAYFPDIPFFEDEYDAVPDRPTTWNQNGYARAYEQLPIGSPPTSQFGSPPNDALSPPNKWPSALNAPLPPSYQNSLPNYAKYGPLGSSVPDKFGIGSPASSGPPHKVGSPRNKEPLGRIPQSSLGLKTTPLGASPGLAESSIGQRIMSNSERHARRTKLPMSSSVPVHNLDDRFGVDSDLNFLPGDLHEEVLTPGEKMRRLSRPDQELSGSFKDKSEGLAIPRRSSNVVGSPPAAGSPSRFRAIFEEQQREKTSTSTSNVGQVGSPLRESWMLDGHSSISGRQSMQMSGISQAMAHIELNRSDSTESNGLRSAALRGGYARQISSPGLHSRRIDEEGEGVFFPMDDESTRRANPVWFDGGRKGTDETNNPATGGGVGIGRGRRPIFGFTQDPSST